MKYMGSKNNLAKHLLPVILKERSEGQTYVEPFVGGANLIDKVQGPRIGNDFHPELIAMWKALVAGWVPPNEVSRDLYYAIKKDPQAHPPHLVAFVGFLCSFGGKWWGGYAADKTHRNYAAEAVRNLQKQVPNLVGVVWVSGDYATLTLPDSSLIYADPPYAGTTEYASGGFDAVRFWNWVRTCESLGHTVFVSEYAAPPDFECLIEVNHTRKLNVTQHRPATERLFRLRAT